MKPVLVALAGGTGILATVQAVGESHVAVSTVAAFIGAGTFGGILLHLVRRSNAIPAEEALKRHEAVDRAHAALTAQGERLDGEMARVEARLMGELQRVEARVMGAIDGGFTREAEERRTFDQRLRDCERELPRRER